MKKSTKGVHWEQTAGAKDDPNVAFALLHDKHMFCRVTGNTYIGSFAAHDARGGTQAFSSLEEAKAFCEDALRDRTTQVLEFLHQVDKDRAALAKAAIRASESAEKAQFRKLSRKYG